MSSICDRMNMAFTTNFINLRFYFNETKFNTVLFVQLFMDVGRVLNWTITGI